MFSLIFVDLHELEKKWLVETCFNVHPLLNLFLGFHNTSKCNSLFIKVSAIMKVCTLKSRGMLKVKYIK